MRTRLLMSVGSVVALVALAMGVVVGFDRQSVAAQAVTAGHPAHIHSGTCATLGDVVYPLSDVGGPMMDASGSPVAETPMGPTTALPVEVSVTTVQADLNTIVSGGHAINVHESADNIGNYIACGDIGGAMMGSDLAIGLGELNGSGASGAAWLHDNGDGTTTVTVFLLDSDTSGGMATPTA